MSLRSLQQKIYLKHCGGKYQEQGQVHPASGVLLTWIQLRSYISICGLKEGTIKWFGLTVHIYSRTLSILVILVTVSPLNQCCCSHRKVPSIENSPSSICSIFKPGVYVLAWKLSGGSFRCQVELQHDFDMLMGLSGSHKEVRNIMPQCLT